MTIKTSSLKQFQKLAGNIKDKSILSVCDYLKFEPGKITKTVLTSFVQFECEGITESFLVDEKELFGILGITVSEFITITKKGNKVTVTDSRDKTTFQVPPIGEFPVIPEPSGDHICLSAEFIETLNMASAFSLAPQLIPTVKSFVMIGKKHIAASDGQIAFIKPIEEDFTMVLGKNIVAGVSKLPITECASANNYNFFFAKGITLGFSTQEIGFFDMIPFITMNGQKPVFTATSSDLQSFNAWALQSIELPFVTIKKGEMVMSDANRDITHIRPMEELTVEEDFTYNPAYMNRLLSAIACSEVDFYKGDRMYYIKSQDHNFTTLIMKLS
jgi:hypothetical protein